ncbi:unnamed protein product [Effrenium voratum]|uniref:Uncharacterized protein n=1 Tax=Effrenium voratum TaxID=2562239 RepID=A0AA36JE03_9DINO|nr:unnamed protein product [Effrenium voratum]
MRRGLRLGRLSLGFALYRGRLCLTPSHWLLCTRGLEPEAESLVRQLHENLQLLPRQHLRPPAEDSDIEGHAAVGELLVRLDGPPRSRLPGIIQSYAYVASAQFPDMALPELQRWAQTLHPQLAEAEELIAPPTQRFRVSVVRDGQHNFTSAQAMVAIGSGVGAVMPWKADMKAYDIEVMAIIHRSRITLGLSCAELGESRKGATHPSKLPTEARAWHLTDARHLRFSTARLMLEFGQLQPGEKVLDLCGGCGTIALEAASQFSNVHAVTADVSGKACKLAEEHIQVAESKGLLAEGSRVQVVFRGIAWWRQTTDKFDAVISELPFGVSRCLSMRFLDPEILAAALRRVLRVGGRAALICPRGQTEAVKAKLDPAIWTDWLCRDGNVGGISVHMIRFRRTGWRPQLD